MKKIITVLFLFSFTVFAYAQEEEALFDEYPPTASLEEKDKVMDKMAEYPGGIMNLRRFVGSHINYPLAAMEAGRSGRVIVKFMVEKDGCLSGFTILKDELGFGAGEEVIRVLKESPVWKPAKINGQAVRSYYTYPVSFLLK